MSQPYRISDYYARYVMTEKQFLILDKLAELPCESFNTNRVLFVAAYKSLAITVEELQTHITKLLSHVQIRALVCGNMYKDVSSSLGLGKVGGLILPIGSNSAY